MVKRRGSSESLSPSVSKKSPTYMSTVVSFSYCPPNRLLAHDIILCHLEGRPSDDIKSWVVLASGSLCLQLSSSGLYLVSSPSPSSFSHFISLLSVSHHLETLKYSLHHQLSYCLYQVIKVEIFQCSYFFFYFILSLSLFSSQFHSQIPSPHYTLLCSSGKGKPPWVPTHPGALSSIRTKNILSH